MLPLFIEFDFFNEDERLANSENHKYLILFICTQRYYYFDNSFIQYYFHCSHKKSL